MENDRSREQVLGLTKTIERLRKDKRELLALTKLVYRVTDGNSENADSIIAAMRHDP
jgi:hypothetical protein